MRSLKRSNKDEWRVVAVRRNKACPGLTQKIPGKIAQSFERGNWSIQLSFCLLAANLSDQSSAIKWKW